MVKRGLIRDKNKPAHIMASIHRQLKKNRIVACAPTRITMLQYTLSSLIVSANDVTISFRIVCDIIVL